MQMVHRDAAKKSCHKDTVFPKRFYSGPQLETTSRDISGDMRALMPFWSRSWIPLIGWIPRAKQKVSFRLDC